MRELCVVGKMFKTHTHTHSIWGNAQVGAGSAERRHWSAATASAASLGHSPYSQAIIVNDKVTTDASCIKLMLITWIFYFVRAAQVMSALNQKHMLSYFISLSCGYSCKNIWIQEIFIIILAALIFRVDCKDKFCEISKINLITSFTDLKVWLSSLLRGKTTHQNN